MEILLAFMEHLSDRSIADNLFREHGTQTPANLALPFAASAPLHAETRAVRPRAPIAATNAVASVTAQARDGLKKR